MTKNPARTTRWHSTPSPLSNISPHLRPTSPQTQHRASRPGSPITAAPSSSTINKPRRKIANHRRSRSSSISRSTMPRLIWTDWRNVLVRSQHRRRQLQQRRKRWPCCKKRELNSNLRRVAVHRRSSSRGRRRWCVMISRVRRRRNLALPNNNSSSSSNNNNLGVGWVACSVDGGEGRENGMLCLFTRKTIVVF
jgi:hypothetical protein